METQETAAAHPLESLEGAIAHLVNEARTKHGHHQLRRDATLHDVARHRASQGLHDQSLTKHVTPIKDVLKRIHGHHGGEALAWGSGDRGTPQALVHAWLNDSSDRAILMNPQFTRFGIGAAIGTFEGNHGAHIAIAELADG
jgi:uncharacterized protein YkwD